jgi:hypothetical protein
VTSQKVQIDRNEAEGNKGTIAIARECNRRYKEDVIVSIGADC